MSFERSAADELYSASAEWIREVADLKHEKVGTQVSILRITRDKDQFTGKYRDAIGDRTDPIWEATTHANAVIRYPYNKVEIFSQRAVGDPGQKFAIGGTDIMELIPIEVELRFRTRYKSTEVDPDETPQEVVNETTGLVKGDLIVDVIIDENKNVIPVILEITRVFMGFNGKHGIVRTAEATLYRRTLEDDIKIEIANYLTHIKNSLINYDV